MKKIIVLLVALGILLAPVSVAHAQEETVYIWLAWPYETYQIREGDNVVMALGFIACTSGLARVFFESFNMEFKLDGEILYETTDRSPYWIVQPFTETKWYDFFGPMKNCIAHPYPNEKHHTMGEFYYTIPSELLKAGNTYTLTFNAWLDHPGTDGFNNLEPFGGVNVYSGHVLYQEYTLIVTE